jgi:hypothetical protein
MKPSLSETVQLRLGEAPWWAVMEDLDGNAHVVPWDEANNSVARGHGIGPCWCQPDIEYSESWKGELHLHHEPTWPNSAESVN